MKILVSGLLPLLAAMCFIAWNKFVQWRLRRDFSDSPHHRRKVQVATERFSKLLLFTVFLIYPGLSSNILRFFFCKNVDGTWYLLNQVDLQCFDEQWFAWLVPVIFLTLLYPIGIPCFLFYKLWTFHKVHMYTLKRERMRI